MARPLITVWDPIVRSGHWIIVFCFAVAFATEDLVTAHVWVGYIIGIVVAFRVFWGFIGPKHARFADFVSSPANVGRYLLDLVQFRAKRNVGHSPAGGAMAIALLVCLAATVVSGLALYGAKDKAGPLGSFYATIESPLGVTPAFAEEERNGETGHERDEGGGLKGLHEALAYLTLVLVVVHVVGVLWASFAYRENLVLAMITGRKRPEETFAGE